MTLQEKVSWCYEHVENFHVVYITFFSCRVILYRVRWPFLSCHMISYATAENCRKSQHFLGHNTTQYLVMSYHIKTVVPCEMGIISQGILPYPVLEIRKKSRLPLAQMPADNQAPDFGCPDENLVALNIFYDFCLVIGFDQTNSTHISMPLFSSLLKCCK